jgi:dTDP-4-dehydrorhamnose 3,5-epimerase
MVDIQESRLIQGVKFARLSVFSDDRGGFLETFRKEWFPERTWDAVQANRSYSNKGVLRGLHYHFHQVDYWYPVSGHLQVGLYDLRAGSPTRGVCEVVELGNSEPKGVLVPVGVAHGFLALTDASLTYLVDNYYDASDEHGVAWNDPEIGIRWGMENPTVSDRDARNPLLRDIPPEALPG